MSTTTVEPLHLQEAIGPKKGDFLEVRNQWAAVLISRGDPNYGPLWMLNGDCTAQRLPTIGQALEIAFRILESAQKGRYPPTELASEPSPDSATEPHT